jgi:hypothetical protein
MACCCVKQMSEFPHLIVAKILQSPEAVIQALMFLFS